MNDIQYSNLKQWFHSYAESYVSEVKHLGILLKIHHTVRVTSNIEHLGHSIGLSHEDILFAKIIALFHDIGRFEQLKRYNTFTDHESVDHADLGLEVLEKEGILDQIDPAYKQTLVTAIFYHNKLAFPRELPDRDLLFVRLIRDADKLDIFRVIADFYTGRTDSKDLLMAVKHGEKISPKVQKDFFQDKPINYSDVQSADDLRLLHLSWIFDVNFGFAFSRLLNYRYLNDIIFSFDDKKRAIKIQAHIESYLKKRVAS